MEPAVTSHTSDADTRDRLIDATGPIFAERGFRDATVREICQVAGANLAAVNYHFGDKLGLYRAVVQHGHELLLGEIRGGTNPGPLAIDPAAEPHRAIRAFIADMVERALRCGNSDTKVRWMFGIMMREMIEPTSVLDDFVERFIRPQQQFNLKAVGTILRLPTDDPRVIRCVYSIVAQVLFYKHCHEVVSRLAPVDSSTPEGRAMLADHIANFTLAALDGLAQKGLA